jgi:protein-tyrosine phosphatase
MSEIIPRVYVGNVDYAKNLKWLKDHNINFIINCAKELPNYHEGKGITYFHLLLHDSENESLGPYLLPSYNFIVNALNSSRKNNILINCFAGMSRSTSITMFFLMRYFNISYPTAYRYMKDMHKDTSPNRGYVKQLTKLGKDMR